MYACIYVPPCFLAQDSAMTDIQPLYVTKRDGRREPIDLDKIHRVLEWAAEGLHNVSVSQVELKSHIQFYDGIRTRDIHETIIKSAADLISPATPDYPYLAARLAIFHLRKSAYGRFEPPHLREHVQRLTAMKRYDAHILRDYSSEEFDLLNSFLDHGRDLTFYFAAVKQLEGKYLIQDRTTREDFDSLLMIVILIVMGVLAN